MVEVLFWSLLAVGIYPYALYPLCVALLGRLRSRALRRDDAFVPTVTVITAAYNEARHIGATVRNKLAQDYPRELLDVIVVSDCSEDRTDDIVRDITAEDGRVRLLRNESRQGKTAGLNYAVPHARGEIIVFADANSIYRADAIRKLVRNFADPDVGYVSGCMLYVNADGSLVGDGCDGYMRYENKLRAMETRVGSIVGVDGGVDAVRRSLYKTMLKDQLPDFVLPLSVVERGYRVVFEPDAVLTEDSLTVQAAEFRMRVRVALRSFWTLLQMRALLNPFRFGVFAWQLASHKLLRYMTFLPLGAAAVLNWFLLERGWAYQLTAAGQVAFFLLTGIALLVPRVAARIPLATYCNYFTLINVASAMAFFQFLAGKKKTVWQPRQG